jgi:hypothetical protein
MTIHQRLRQLESIEHEVFEKIRTGVPEGQQKKFVVQEIARDVFLAHYPRSGSLTQEGSRIARHIFYGGFAAAEALDWKVEKAVKHLARGLLLGIRESGGDFFTCARVVVRSAILCAMSTHYDLSKLAERVIAVILKAGQEQECNMDELTRMISRTAIDAAGSFPDEDFVHMERILMGLLAGRVHLLIASPISARVLPASSLPYPPGSRSPFWQRASFRLRFASSASRTVFPSCRRRPSFCNGPRAIHRRWWTAWPGISVRG